MGVIEGESTVEIDVPIERVWALVQDVAKAPEWQGGLSKMTPLERDAAGRATLCDAETDAKVTTVKTQLRFSYREPTLLEWTIEKSMMKSAKGHWELVDLGDGRTRASYWLRADLGRLGLLIRGPLVDLLRKQLVGARAGELKKAMEAGG